MTAGEWAWPGIMANPYETSAFVSIRQQLSAFVYIRRSAVPAAPTGKRAPEHWGVAGFFLFTMSKSTHPIAGSDCQNR